MILFRKKLILTALFTVNLGVCITLNSNADACNCQHPNCACNSDSTGYYEPDCFDVNQLKYSELNDEPITNDANHWQLKENCQAKGSFKLKNSVFEITSGKKFEAPFNSNSAIDLDNSTFLVNEGGKYRYQSNNFNTFTNGTKGVFAPRSSVIWNGLNYRLIDATDSSFVVYPGAFINALKFDVVHKHHINYIIDGNNKSSTIFLNRVVKPTDITGRAIKNPNIMGVVLDMKVVLPPNNEINKYEMTLDKSKQFLNFSLYPNLYFENCEIIYSDYKKDNFEMERITDWKIRSNNQNPLIAKKAVLSERTRILNPTSPDGSKFAEYDIKFGYAKIKDTGPIDHRANFPSVFDSTVPNYYNIKSITKNGTEYRCYFDLTLLTTECFQYRDGENAYNYFWNNGDGDLPKGILHHMPIVLNVGLIGDGNQEVSLLDYNTRQDYKQVELYGDNTGYSGQIVVSPKTEKVIFGDKSYTRVDQLFNLNRKNIEMEQCDVEFQGSNDILAGGQSVDDFTVTKDAKTVRLVPGDNNAIFDIEGKVSLDSYESGADDDTDDGSFIVEEGVEVNA